MNLSWIDWTIVFASIILIRIVSWKTRSLMRGVADFLSANRAAGRYLLTISGEMGGFGVITLVAGFQAFTAAGFPTLWWGMMSMPLGVIFSMTGWVFYRLRETRALTVAQFFEMRYSRKFRIFAGLLCWLSGIINFGIFPAIAARFLIYFCGLPDIFTVAGVHIATYPALMVADLGLALFFVSGGGQISVMVTECVQGMVALFAYIAIAVAVIVLIPWGHAVTAMNTAPADASMLNPFHTAGVQDFNAWFYLIGIFLSTYGFQTWLGAQGFMTSARNPHEQRMGNLISGWRRAPLYLIGIVLPLAAFTVMHLPQYAGLASGINADIHRIGSTTLQNEMSVPIALAHILPIGIKGLLAMVVIFLSITCHDTYMHSWGAIFVQDVLIPWRGGKALEPEQHVRWLRYSIFFVAVFAFFFSLFYVETDKILFFQAITGTIWLGGAGAVMIGGLYSRFGTTAGAYAAMIAGAVLGIGGLVMPHLWEAHHATKFPINGQWLSLISSGIAIALYVGISLITGGARRPFNLEKMLHRGAYSVDPHEHETKSVAKSRWQELLGMGSEFSKGDRFLAILFAVWTFGWWAVFISVCVAHFAFHAISDAFWAPFWRTYIILLMVQCVPVSIWFTIGGVKDIRDLLQRLETAKRDPLDDGRVSHGDIPHNTITPGLEGEEKELAGTTMG
jgi:SSS family solute:Na+ symporter